MLAGGTTGATTLAPMANETARNHWNVDGGRVWVEFQESFDALLEPFVPMLTDLVLPQSNVLEVGCGTGALSLALSDMAAYVTAVDISRPMLERAQERADEILAASIDFVEADAQVDAIPGGPFDVIVSRFGVMFFDDPVGAFRNLHSVANEGAVLGFVCWQGASQQEWLRPPIEATARHVAAAPEPDADPRAPGMMALADANYVTSILTDAGFRDVSCDPVTLDLRVGLPGAGVDSAIAYYEASTRSREVLDQLDDETRAAVRSTLRELLTPHLDAHGDVRLSGAVWFVRARA